MTTTVQAHLAITVDTECDKGQGWAMKTPIGLRSVTEGIPDHLEKLLRAFSAPATYLLSAEVLEDDECVAVLNDCRSHGAELGTHLHGEFVEPDRTMGRRGSAWDMQCRYSNEIEGAKLRNLTGLFRERLGFAPVSFRAGRFGLGRHTLRHLEQLGYLVDSSVVPFHEWKDDGGEVSFFGCPTYPYFPDYRDPLVEGQMGILELPVTVGSTWWRIVPKRALRSVPKHPILWALPRKLLRRQLNPVWLRPTFESSESIKEMLCHEIKRGRRQLYLVMMLHSVELVPDCSPYVEDEQDRKRFLERLKEILTFCSSRGVSFVTLREMRRVFESGMLGRSTRQG